MSRTFAKDNDSTEDMQHTPRKEKEYSQDKPLAASLRSDDYDKDRMGKLRDSRRVSQGGKRKARAL